MEKRIEECNTNEKDVIDQHPRWLKCYFTSATIVGLLGTGAQDVHLYFHTAPELWQYPLAYISFCLRIGCDEQLHPPSQWTTKAAEATYFE